MSQSNIARFPRRPAKRRENNPKAAEAARARIAELPESYLAHAVPSSELAAGSRPVSPAAGNSGSNEAPAEKDEDKHGPRTAAEIVKAASGEPESSPGDQALPSRLKPLITGVVTFVLLFLVFKSPIFLSQLNYLLHPSSTTSAQTNKAAATSRQYGLADSANLTVRCRYRLAWFEPLQNLRAC